jgi:dihydroorotase
MSLILFKNARLLDPSQKLDQIGDLLVEDGIIVSAGPNIGSQADKVENIVDCEGLALIPGLIDMQVYTGEPGDEHRETLATASLAAAQGGVTTMIVMPNTRPVIDDAALVDFIRRRARDTAIIRIHPMAAITKGCDSDQLTEFGLLMEAGAVAFSNGDQAVMNALTMRRAMSYAANFDALIVHHPMDQDLARAGVMHESELSMRLGLSGIPSAAEAVILDRDLRLVELTGARYHVSQISCSDSVAALRSARSRGLNVTSAVSANHLMLNENDVENYRSFAKLNPPLRGETDRMALVDGLADGTIDVVVSGHNPQDADAKRQPFDQAAYGSIGIETLLTSLITLHQSEQLDLLNLLATVTQHPAEILGLNTGTLQAGRPADLALVDLGLPWVIDADRLTSKSKNAALDGRRVQGAVIASYIGGKCIFARDNIE